MPVLGALRSLWNHRALIARLSRRDISARWRGSFLGPLWAVAMPLFLLAVYSFVFSTILKGRWAPAAEGQPAPPFAIVLFTGLILFQLFSETINASPGIVRTNATFVKQVVFPLEILPVVAFVGALFQTLVSALVLAAGYVILWGLPPASSLWLPLAILPLPFLTLGLAWLLAAIGAFVRDTAQVAALLTTILMFLCPIFYPLDAVPQAYRFLVLWNPLSVVVSGARAALFGGPAPGLAEIAISTAVSLVFFELGYRFFCRTKEAFIDAV